MRFLLFSLFLLLWGGLWWWHYTCHIKQACCPEGFLVEEVRIGEDEFGGRPLLFLWSNSTGFIGPAFDSYRDSLLNWMSSKDTLLISGYFFLDEENNSDADDLGIARALAVSKLFPGLQTESRLKLDSENLPLQGDFRSRAFEAVRFSIIEGSELFPEIARRSLLYFPYNSTSSIEEEGLKAYLDSLALRLKQTGERVILTGHTDDTGNNNSNYYLGLWRAGAVKDYLVDQGIQEGRIEISSKGEIAPIASNETIEGKKKNRRVELEIIQEN